MRTSNRSVRAFAASLSFVTAVAASLTGLSADAATFNYTDPVCNQFYVAPSSNGDVVLRCVQGLACTVSPNGSYIVQTNTPVTLTATCAPSAQTYAWSIAARSPQGCPFPAAPGNGNTLQLPSSSVPITCWYDVAASDALGTSQGTTRYGIVWTSGSPPSGCSISTSPSPPSLPSSGGNVSMTVSCTSGAPFTSYSWQKNSVNFGTNAATQGDSLPPNTTTSPVTYTYGVSVCNAAGCTPAQTTFTVAGQTVSAGLCGQYTNIIQTDLPTGNPDQLITQSLGGFMANGVFVGRFVAGASSAVAPGQFNWAEYQDAAPYNRVLTVSTQACDFRTFGTFQTDPTGTNAPLMWEQQGGPGQGAFLYSISPTAAPSPPSVQLQAGQTYYVNMRNIDLQGNITCGTSTCNMIVQHVLPR